ncbi:hypothetical protein BV908_14145 [Diaphorobacter sp. LR2014-1]|nr:hypothetical protein BV908_14145 [Diaphorobacter sp. LR2014-1]
MALDVQGGKVVKVSGIKTHPTNFGRLREQGALLWAWLQEGAHFYVCGDAGRMARDVDAALRQIVQEHGAMTADAATDYLACMSRDRRYARDVY